MAISHLRPAAIGDFYNITKITQPQLRNVELYINNPKLVTLRLLYRPALFRPWITKFDHKKG